MLKTVKSCLKEVKFAHIFYYINFHVKCITRTCENDPVVSLFLDFIGGTNTEI